MVTHALAEIFASLYSQGFGGPTETQEEENGGDDTKDTTGTGMGEGAGIKDVSEQIEDEDQLLGTEKVPSQFPNMPLPCHLVSLFCRLIISFYVVRVKNKMPRMMIQVKMIKA